MRFIVVYKIIFLGMEKRLKFAKDECKKTIDKIKHLKAEIKNLEQELFVISPKIEALEATIEEGEEKMNETRQNMISIEDDIFTEFCDKCEVKDIREFELINIRFLLFYMFLT